MWVSLSKVNRSGAYQRSVAGGGRPHDGSQTRVRPALPRQPFHSFGTEKLIMRALGARRMAVADAPIRDAGQSTRAPEALTTGAQASTSAWMKRLKSCGLFFSTTAPSLA